MANIKGRISITVVEGLQPGDEVRDPFLKGFGCRRRGNKRTYFVQRRVLGRMVRVTIGAHGSPWTPDTARKEATDLLLLMSRGINPVVARREAQGERRTVEDMAKEFLQEHGKKLKPSTRDMYQSLVDHHISRHLGKMSVGDVTERDVEGFHQDMAEHPRAANHALAVLSKMMSWCETQGYRRKGSNPCGAVKRYDEVARNRYLTAAELEKLGEVLHTYETTPGYIGAYTIAAIKMLILTGARRGEILQLKWSYVDLERKMLFLPDSKTGAKSIPLSEPAVVLLRDLPREEGNPYVFPGRIAKKPLGSVKHAWETIRTDAGLGDVRLHDLRHSFASVAVGLGGSLPILGRALGHKNQQTTARYAHLADSPVRALVDVTGAVLGKALQVKDTPLPSQTMQKRRKS